MDLPFTRADLKAAIPEHCFQPSNARSFAHLAFDLCVIAAAYGALYGLKASGVSAWYLEVLLVFLIGTMAWAIFVIGHEAGHGAFSASRRVNTVVGVLTHGALLVPYRSWQHSHASHHMNTGHLNKEEVFRPVTPGKDRLFRKIIFRSGTFILYGWPMYLLGFRNIETYSPIKGSHFLTVSDLYAVHVRGSYLAASPPLPGSLRSTGHSGFTSAGASSPCTFWPRIWCSVPG